jgi:hypothetical protein
MKKITLFLVTLLLFDFVLGQVMQNPIDDALRTFPPGNSKLQMKRHLDQPRQLPLTNRIFNLQANKSVNDRKPLDSIISQEWDENLAVWTNAIREKFTYNAEDYVSETILSLWNSNTSIWQIFQKEEYTFDTNGNLLELIRSYQFQPNVWSPSEKIQLTYDTNGNEILEERFSWDIFANSWVNTYKYESTYNTNGYLDTYIGYEWFPNSNQWVNSSKEEFYYVDPTGMLDYQISSLWNFGLNQWDLDSKWEVVARTGFQPSEEIRYDWDTNSSTWINQSRYVYELTVMLSAIEYAPTRETAYLWDMASSSWIELYMDEYQYDSNTNRTLGMYYEWNATMNDWESYYQDEFVFDLNYDLADLVVPYFYDEMDAYVHIANMVIGYFGSEADNQIWIDTNKILFFYSNYSNPLGTEEQEIADALIVYPNPTYSTLFINSLHPIDKVEIFNLNGQKLKELRTGLNEISMNDIVSGIYLVKISTDNRSVVKRVIKQ